MKKTLSILLIFAVVCCLFAGCGKSSDNDGTIYNNESSVTEPSGTSSDPVDADFSQADEDMFTDRDCKTEYDESKAVSVQLNGD